MKTLGILAAFLRRDWSIDLSYRASFVLQLVSSVLFMALFFYLARVIDDAEFAAREDVDGGYFAYAAVGLALLQIVQVSLANFSRKLREEQTSGTLETLMTTPVSPSMIVLSSAIYDLLRATLNGLLLIGAAVLIFGLRIQADPASIGIAVVALSGCLGLFASLGVAVAAFTIVFKRTTALLGIVVATLALLGGVYFPIEVLPGPLQVLAEALPFTWALDVLRASLLGGEVDAVQLAGLFAAAAVLLPAALVGFAAAVRRARKTGTLAAY